MNPVELGKFIAKLRNEKHLTQDDLADKLFIDKRKISRWECGTSVPEFEMLIKLSEILDVSLYELSICKRIENEKITRRVLNKLKGIKDIKKIKFRKKIFYFFVLILLILFSITCTYTIKNHGTIEVYELKSLDEDYNIRGYYYRIQQKYFFNITRIDFNSEKNNLRKTFDNDCKYEIYDGNFRVLNIDYNDINGSILTDSNYKYEIISHYKIGKNLSIKVNCNNESNHSFEIKLMKVYDNKIF